MSPFVEGVRDLLPAEIRERRWVYQELRKVFAGEGYQEVSTPTLESLELYADPEILNMQEQMFKVVDERGQILVLRPDLTMPIARLAATRYNKTPVPWKFCYISTAYQSSRGQSYQMKEKTQAGVELLGRGDLLSDVEVIGLLIQALQQVGIENPQVDLGQAALVRELFEMIQLPVAAKAELRALMEDKNIEEMKVRLQEWQVTTDEAELLLAFPLLFGEPEEVLRGLKALPLSAKGRQIVGELEQLHQLLTALGYGEYITLDPAMVTQLGYYTGTIFRAYVQGFGEVVASGGRYDGLARQFGLDVPAVGFAIEIERLMTCLQQRNLLRTGGDVQLVLHVDAGCSTSRFAKSYQAVQTLARQGIPAELYVGDEFSEYCRFHQVPFMAWWDEDKIRIVATGSAGSGEELIMKEVARQNAVGEMLLEEVKEDETT